MGRWGDGEMGRWGDGETRRRGDKRTVDSGQWAVGSNLIAQMFRALILID